MRVGDKRQTAVIVRVPKWNLAARKPLILISAENDELARKVALRQRRLIGCDRREKTPEENQPNQNKGGDRLDIVVLR